MVMVTVVTEEPPDAPEKTLVPVESDDKFTVMFEAALIGVPAAFCSWTAIGPSVALLLAVPDTGAEVITSLF